MNKNWLKQMFDVLWCAEMTYRLIASSNRWRRGWLVDKFLSVNVRCGRRVAPPGSDTS